MFILEEQPTVEAENLEATAADPAYYEHRGIQQGYSGNIILLLGGYFRNTAIPKGSDYTVRVDVDYVSPYRVAVRVAVCNSEGQIVSQGHASDAKGIERLEKILLKKAKRSIFIGVPYRGFAMQGTMVAVMYSGTYRHEL